MPREEIIEQLDRVMRETDWERVQEEVQAMREARDGDDGEIYSRHTSRAWTKRYALCPEEREKPCLHEWGKWTGTIPCTGRYMCQMCGADLDPNTNTPLTS